MNAEQLTHTTPVKREWLIPEKPVLVIPALACAYGVQEAIMLQQIRYNLDRLEGRVIDGEKYIYMSAPKWKEQLPFWSLRIIRQLLLNLETAGAIKSGCFNDRGYDKTKWYTINYESVLEPVTVSSHHVTKTSHRSDKKRQSKSPKSDIDVTQTVTPIPETTTKNTTETTTEIPEGDRASAKTSPLQTEADHVTDKVQMVKPEPRKELLYEPKVQPSKPESNAPPSVPAVSPVDDGPMIDALATACMKFVKLPKHYEELKKTADSLIMLGFTADDVMQWRARCWPDHWKTKKGQPVPTLDDVLNNIGQVRTLPAAPVSTNAYLSDPYFAGREDDDPPDAFTEDELPPRQLAQLDHTTARRWHQAVTQVSGRLSATEGKAFEADVNAIGMVGKNTIVIEIATEEKRKKFVKGYMPFLESEFNRFDGRSDDNVKPPISFALVIVGDEQYRTDSEVTR